MSDDPSGPMTLAQLETLTDALRVEIEEPNRRIYRNPAGVTCPDPRCDRGPFDALIVGETGWQEFGAQAGGIHLHITTVGESTLLFIHEPKQNAPGTP